VDLRPTSTDRSHPLSVRIARRFAASRIFRYPHATGALYMPFGLRNAGQTLQRFLDEVTQGLAFCFVYLDDILIASKSAAEHKEHLRLLFERLSKYGVVLNPAKCVLGASEVTFLGHQISAAGTRPLEDRVKAIQDFPRPETCAELRRFLGMLNFYRRFVPHIAATQGDLDALLCGTDMKKITTIEYLSCNI
jgi:hypothetical protein